MVTSDPIGGFCRRQSEPRPLAKTGWQQLTRHCNTKYLKIVSVYDLKPIFYSLSLGA
jgi:hypothetical protein